MSEALGVDAQAGAEDATPGALLRRERERRALSVQQTAEDLHLDSWIIEAIEANRFHALGAPVYAKGHLRKYAARLGLPVEDLVARYEALQDRPVAMDPIPMAVAAPVRPPRRSWKTPLRIVLFLLLAAGLGWLVVELLAFKESAPVAQPMNSPLPAPAQQAVPEAVAPTDTRPLAQQLGEDVPAAPGEAPAAQSDVPATSIPAAPASADAANETVELQLEYSGESWTEVYDAQGRRLMFAMGAPGRTRILSGVSPLQVTLGAASVVTARVNGRAIAIPERDGRDSARFAVGADGILR